MAHGSFHFPRGFLWGTATSAYQVEGNSLNNTWWEWEGRQGKILTGDSCGLACDWWGGHWRDDLDRAAEGGHNALRISIEWSRVQPTPNRWDEDALERYRLILRGMRERGLTALVGLHHFADPLWLDEQGGWENPASAEHFERYAARVGEALQEYANLWITINEPNLIVVFGFLMDLWPPGRKSIPAAYQATRNLLLAHARAYHAIHSLQPDSRIGLSHQIHPLQPRHPGSPLDRLAARSQSALLNTMIPAALDSGDLRFLGRRTRLPELRGTQDFFGVNYYTREQVSFDLRRPGELFGRRSFPKGADLCDSAFIANDPEGLFQTLRWANRFKLPIIITENGVNDASDRLRPRYLIQHLHQAWRAVNFNFPVKGYFHWTLVDNFEWERGWGQRYGLWELDPRTQTRRKRPSADLYAEICQENGITSEMVQRYAPEISTSLFPD